MITTNEEELINAIRTGEICATCRHYGDHDTMICDACLIDEDWAHGRPNFVYKECE